MVKERRCWDADFREDVTLCNGYFQYDEAWKGQFCGGYTVLKNLSAKTGQIDAMNRLKEKQVSKRILTIVILKEWYRKVGWTWSDIYTHIYLKC